MATTTLTTPMAGSVRSTYQRNDVEFLIADLGHYRLETSLADRERWMSDGGHYSDLLPIEYRPTVEYSELFEQILSSTATTVAAAVAATAERVMLRHLRDHLTTNNLVLVSLARAGTPVGVLLVRYLRRQHIDVAHYTISIVRGRGLDMLAIDHILEHHPDAHIQFVDGWTGKGAISTELAAACENRSELNATLAVVADPGNVTDLFGTRNDLLLPSACLNSTVSGLVSRTVYRPDLTSGRHGAKFYEHLVPDDVSDHFISTIEAVFPPSDVVVAAAEELERCTPVTFGRGARDVERIAATHGISDINFVKPGIGETLRVLLRRDPWKILVADLADEMLAPILALASEKHIPVEVFTDMTYRACGLIKHTSTDA